MKRYYYLFVISAFSGALLVAILLSDAQAAGFFYNSWATPKSKTNS